MATIAEKNIILRISADTKKAQKDISNVSKSVTGLSGIVRSAASTFGGLFAFSGAQAIAGQISNLSRQTVSLAISAEQTQVAFETFLGSASAANKILGELNQFSAVTPFEPEQVIKAGQSLLAFGVDVENIIPSVQKIGDIAAGTGTDFNELAEIFGKAKTQGRLFGEDINQLTGRGIPIIAEFAKQFGVAESEVKGLVTQGRIGFPELEKAFGTLTSEGGKFFDLMNKQSQTVGGRISTLTGNFNELLKSIGERLLPVIGETVDFFNQLTKSTKELIELQPSEEIQKEAASLQALTFELNRANTSEERRKAIVDQINRQYPKLLDNQDIEAGNYAAITRELQKANKALIANAVLERQRERVASQIDRIAISQESLNRQVEVQEFQIGVANKLLGEEIQFQKTLDEQRTDAIINLEAEILALKNSAKRRRESAVTIAQLAAQLRVLEGTEIIRQERIESIAFGTATLEDKQLSLNKLIENYSDEIAFSNDRLVQNTDDTQQNTTAKDANATSTGKQTKAEKERLKAIEKAEKEFARIQALAVNADTKRIFDKFDAEIKAAVEAEERRIAEIEHLKRSELDDEEQFNKDARIIADRGIAEDLAAATLSIANKILARKKAGETFEDLEIEQLEAQLAAAEIGSLEAIEIEQKLVDARKALRDKEFNEAIERQRKFLDTTQQVLNATIDITKQAFEAREAILDEQIEKQEKRVKSALELAENGNAELLQAEEDRLVQLNAQREKNARRLQQIGAVEIAVNQAIAVSQGIVAVTAGFAENFALGIATSVALAATVAAAVISVNQAFAGVQGFAEGTEYVDGPGGPKSDSIPAMLSKGERVVPANVNAKYFDALNEFQAGTPKADMMASLMRGEVPRVKRDRVASGGGLNTRSMEKHLEGINKRLDNLQMQVNLDKDGFSASLQKFQERQERSKKLIR